MTGKVVDGIEIRPEPCRMCKHRARCKREELACDEFVGYVGRSHGNRGKAWRREPNKGDYYRVFPNLNPERKSEVIE